MPDEHTGPLVPTPKLHPTGTPPPDSASVTPSPEEAVEGAVPPGYDWPTHGGYLGCLVGVVASLLVSGLIGANFLSVIWAAGRLAGPLFIALTIVVFLVCMGIFGRVGYVLGKRFYRAYAQPARPVWGEDTSVVAPAEDGISAARTTGRLGTVTGISVACIIGVWLSIKLFGLLVAGDAAAGWLFQLLGVLTYLLFVFLTFAGSIFALGWLGRAVDQRLAASATRDVGAPHRGGSRGDSAPAQVPRHGEAPH